MPGMPGAEFSLLFFFGPNLQHTWANKARVMGVVGEPNTISGGENKRVVIANVRWS